MSSTQDILKYNRWKKFSKNSEFEEPTDPFLTHRRRFNVEMSRYLSNLNLNYQPPMPKPFLMRQQKQAQQQNRHYYDHLNLEDY